MDWFKASIARVEIRITMVKEAGAYSKKGRWEVNPDARFSSTNVCVTYQQSSVCTQD